MSKENLHKTYKTIRRQEIEAFQTLKRENNANVLSVKRIRSTSNVKISIFK